MADARAGDSSGVDRALVVAARRSEVAEFLALNLRGHGISVHRIARDADFAFVDGSDRETVVVGYVADAEDAGLFEEVVRTARSSYALGLVDRKAPAAVMARADAVAASVLHLPVASDTLAESVRSLLTAPVPPTRVRPTLEAPADVLASGFGGAQSARSPRAERSEADGGWFSRVPEELRQFLASPHPRTLLVKGHPGTGKTTLALALLEYATRPGYYLSNRVSMTSLPDYHPQLRYRLPPDHVLDSDDFQRVVTGSEAWDDAVDLLLLDRDPLEREPGHEGPPLPPPVRELLARVRADRSNPPPVVVVDSWEALGRTFAIRRERRARVGVASASTEEAFLHLIHDAGSHLVFVLETEAETPLDYLADGIVTLERESRHDRLFRRVRFDKLRGTSTQRMVRPFTLDGGAFRALEPPTAESEAPGRAFRWEPLPADGETLSWGNEAADRFWGRLRPGGSYLWENAPSVPTRALQALALAPVLQNLVRGWTIVLLPSLSGTPAAYPQTLAALLHPQAGRVARENLFLLPGDTSRLLEMFAERPDEAGSPSVGAAPPDAESSGAHPPVLQALLAATRPRTLFAANVLGLHAASGLDDAALGTFLSRWITRVHDRGAVLMLGVPTGHPTLPALEYRMLGHYRWGSYHGTLFVAGEKPFTPFFAVEPDTEAGGYPLCRLLPVS